MRTALPTEYRQHLHWETALDRLELDVIHAERMLDDPAAADMESWDEPQLAGPIPADLVERALTIRARQERVQQALAARLGDLRRQHEFADRVDRATGRAGRPVYVDVDA
ncbi:hypothetical protein [Nocardioides sp. LS1]|uniref:hypothetical protein n=1 Tax=Nocardioides sp. LS1 TaxID=1027620 RepID=UPI000F61C2A2|nr:hypothetical protein [Nocardioides sp. LS1]GCD89533.1 hypothetical protein NLS1_15390 [Nocardioides sp. LS1]